MENLAHSTDRTNKFLAERAIKDANEITACFNKLSAVLREMEILNIKHDIGCKDIHEIRGKFIDAVNERIANAKQLGSK